MGDAIAQVVIIGCALVSQMLIPSKLAGRRRIGFFVALLAQPAWFYTTYSNGQWGLLTINSKTRLPTVKIAKCCDSSKGKGPRNSEGLYLYMPVVLETSSHRVPSHINVMLSRAPVVAEKFPFKAFVPTLSCIVVPVDCKTRVTT